MSALESATALFDQGKFEEALTAATTALEQPGIEPATTRSLKLLIRKCKTHVEGGGVATGDAPVDVSALPTQPTPAAAPTAAAPTAAAAPAGKPTTFVRHEWFQTGTNVTFSFYVKNRTQDQVQVSTEARSLDVSIKLENGSEFQLSHEPLFGEIDAEKTVVAVKQPKVEVVLVKKIPNLYWSAIELTGSAAAAVATAGAAPPAAALPATQAQLAYPNSKGKDWSKFNADEDGVDEKKLSADEGLNKLFQNIYKDASDDNRRAMMKSFQESGGTVLSTNWEDVGKRKVEGEAPKGLEMKKYEQ